VICLIEQLQPCTISISHKYITIMSDRLRNISKKRKFVADGVFYAELNELLTRELAEAGYAGVEIRNSPTRTEIVIRATQPQEVVGENARRIRDLTTVVADRFKFAPGTLEMYAEMVQNRGLCAEAQAESLRFKLLSGLQVRRAAYSIIRTVMESGAKGAEVIVTGKLQGARAKAVKFRDGYMIKTGHSNQLYVQKAVRHLLLRQGVIGMKVAIMLPHDPTGREGPKVPLADVVKVHEAKDTDAANVMGKPTRRVAQQQPVA
jgi:small subunit ribosomal protein S3e